MISRRSFILSSSLGLIAARAQTVDERCLRLPLLICCASRLNTFELQRPIANGPRCGAALAVRLHPNILNNATQAILIEHTDAQDGVEGKAAGWPERLNDQRQAYLGTRGWPEVRAALPRLVRESGVMSITPPIVDACIGDLLAVCDVKPFCLIQAPPYYHTDHDTLDKISRAGLEA